MAKAKVEIYSEVKCRVVALDLTKARKGTKRYGGEIDYCPKCGRKGRRHVGYENRRKEGIRHCIEVFDHYVEIDRLAGMAIQRITSHCFATRTWDEPLPERKAKQGKVEQ